MKTCQHCHILLTPKQRKNCEACSLQARRDRNHKWHKDNKSHRAKSDRKNHQSPSYRWLQLKRNGSSRGLDLSITRDQFEILSKKPCLYCLGLLDNDLGMGTHIDRLDNNLGYSYENSTSCCGFCNKIKQDLLTPEETKAVIKIIIEMRKVS